MMAKKLAKALAGINCLLLMAVIYFIQVNDNKMLILTGKLSVAALLVFLFVSLIFRAMETDIKTWQLVAIIGGFALAYLIYLGIGQIAAQAVRRDQIAGLGGLEFFKNLVLTGLVLTIPIAVISGLAGRKGGRHDN